MKFGKVNVLDRLASEHFIYASEKLYVLLCICFSAMLLHIHAPTQFSNTILVPIIKDKKGNITDPDNHRPIAITTVASKIFLNVILHNIKDCGIGMRLCNEITCLYCAMKLLASKQSLT